MLGNVPPRLGGVRVYEKNTHDDEVIKLLSKYDDHDRTAGGD